MPDGGDLTLEGAPLSGAPSRDPRYRLRDLDGEPSEDLRSLLHDEAPPVRYGPRPRLASIRTAVELLNGTIECENTLGAGTTFAITRPEADENGDGGENSSEDIDRASERRLAPEEMGLGAEGDPCHGPPAVLRLWTLAAGRSRAPRETVDRQAGVRDRHHLRRASPRERRASGTGITFGEPVPARGERPGQASPSASQSQQEASVRDRYHLRRARPITRRSGRRVCWPRPFCGCSLATRSTGLLCGTPPPARPRGDRPSASRHVPGSSS